MAGKDADGCGQGVVGAAKEVAAPCCSYHSVADKCALMHVKLVLYNDLWPVSMKETEKMQDCFEHSSDMQLGSWAALQLVNPEWFGMAQGRSLLDFWFVLFFSNLTSISKIPIFYKQVHDSDSTRIRPYWKLDSGFNTHDLWLDLV